MFIMGKIKCIQSPIHVFIYYYHYFIFLSNLLKKSNNEFLQDSVPIFDFLFKNFFLKKIFIIPLNPIDPRANSI